MDHLTFRFVIDDLRDEATEVLLKEYVEFLVGNVLLDSHYANKITFVSKDAVIVLEVLGKCAVFIVVWNTFLLSKYNVLLQDWRDYIDAFALVADRLETVKKFSYL